MWPTDPEAQAYAVLFLTMTAIAVGVLAMVSAERRYWRRKLARIGARHHERLTALRHDRDWALSQLNHQRPPADPVVEHWRATPAWSAARSAEHTIVTASADPDATTRIHRLDDGRDAT